jgi:hypothetical protein
VSTVLPGERGDGKIQGWHRDRLAVIYVRQSSRQQVADHGESTLMALAEDPQGCSLKVPIWLTLSLLRLAMCCHGSCRRVAAVP